MVIMVPGNDIEGLHKGVKERGEIITERVNIIRDRSKNIRQ